ncbi:RNA-directed DNA polymerase [Bertholletia excelsa]
MGMKSLFCELDETHKVIVRLGDDKLIQVEGKGTIALETKGGKVKFLHDVFFIPSLSHNLLSVGQLLASGYSIMFHCDACVIRDKKSGQVVVNVSMAENKMFPFEVSNVNHHAPITSKKSEYVMWHLRYELLNVKSLQLLS